MKIDEGLKLYSHRLANWPETISLDSRRLRDRRHGREDFLQQQQIGKVVFALHNDLDSVQQLTEKEN